MKRDFNQVLRGLDGKPLTQVEVVPQENGTQKRVEKPFTLGSACTEALLATYQDEQGLPGDEKVKRFKLAQKIHGAGELVEVQSEDLVLLKHLIGKAFNALVVGQAYDLLEADC